MRSETPPFLHYAVAVTSADAGVCSCGKPYPLYQLPYPDAKPIETLHDHITEMRMS
jgi:hypothetical protein